MSASGENWLIEHGVAIGAFLVGVVSTIAGGLWKVRSAVAGAFKIRDEEVAKLRAETRASSDVIHQRVTDVSVQVAEIRGEMTGMKRDLRSLVEHQIRKGNGFTSG